MLILSLSKVSSLNTKVLVTPPVKLTSPTLFVNWGEAKTLTVQS